MALTDNLLAYYKLDDDSAVDALGNYNGTEVGDIGYGYESGKINQCAFFGAGNGNVIELPDSLLAVSGSQQSFTVNFWMKTIGTSNSGTRANTDGWIMCIGTPGSMVSFYFVSIDDTIKMGSAYLGTFLNEDTIADDLYDYMTSTYSWHMVTISCDQMDTFVYVDGVQVNLYLDKQIEMSSTNYNRLGNWDDLNVPYNGLLDEIGFWNRDLSQSEITQLYNSGNGLQYPFNEDSGLNPGILRKR